LVGSRNMVIVAGGDSFTFGSELPDQIKNTPSLSTYPALLAKEISAEYYCAARPGNANNAISRMTLAACENLKNQNKKIGAIVTWTFTNRYEFKFNCSDGQEIDPWYSISAWSLLDNISDIEQEFIFKNRIISYVQQKNLRIAQKYGIADFAKIFFKHVGNDEYYELYSSLKEIVFLQNYFVTNNIPYLFIPAENYFYNHSCYYRRKDEFIDSLYNQIDWSKWFFFESDTAELKGFYSWAVENKYPMGTTHPLEQAHLAAAEIIKSKFNDLCNR
jgi:hypothetical protein